MLNQVTSYSPSLVEWFGPDLEVRCTGRLRNKTGEAPTLSAVRIIDLTVGLFWSQCIFLDPLNLVLICKSAEFSHRKDHLENQHSQSNRPEWNMGSTNSSDHNEIRHCGDLRPRDCGRALQNYWKISVVEGGWPTPVCRNHYVRNCIQWVSSPFALWSPNFYMPKSTIENDILKWFAS